MARVPRNIKMHIFIHTYIHSYIHLVIFRQLLKYIYFCFPSTEHLAFIPAVGPENAGGLLVLYERAGIATKKSMKKKSHFFSTFVHDSDFKLSGSR